MSSKLLASRSAAGWAVISVTGILALLVQAKEPSLPTAAKAVVVKPATAEPAPDGRELFAREWLPNDSRAHGGDGLGPVFNDSSCLACHNQGAAGGGGPASKNVDIITAFSLSMENVQVFVAPQAAPQTMPQGLFNLAFGAIAPPELAPRRAAKGKQPAVPHVPTAEERKLAKQREKEQLMKIHPGFASARSVVLHHFGTDPKYEQWRSGFFGSQNFGMFDGDDLGGAPFSSMSFASRRSDTAFVPQQPSLEVSRLQNDVRLKHSQLLNSTIQAGNIQISHSQRNPTALYGVGLIDAIPEQAIVELATLEQAKVSESGRPAGEAKRRQGRPLRLESPKAVAGRFRPNGLRRRTRFERAGARAGGRAAETRLQSARPRHEPSRMRRSGELSAKSARSGRAQAGDGARGRHHRRGTQAVCDGRLHRMPR